MSDYIQKRLFEFMSIEFSSFILRLKNLYRLNTRFHLNLEGASDLHLYLVFGSSDCDESCAKTQFANQLLQLPLPEQ